MTHNQPSSIGMGSHRATLKVLWQDEDLNLFTDELSGHFEHERSKHGTISKDMIRKGEKALEHMLEYHSLLKHMHEIEIFQIEEIDQLKEKVVESKGKVDVLSGIRTTLEAEVADLRGQLKEAQEGNAKRKAILETRDNQLMAAGEASKEAKAKFEDKMKEEAAAKDEIMVGINAETGEIQESNKKMSTAVNKAEQSTKQLKVALNECSDTLKDVTETEYEKGHKNVTQGEN